MSSRKFENIFSPISDTVLITGANGQLGRTLVNLFLENDCQVIALDLNLGRLQTHKNLHTFETDITNLIRVREVFEKLIQADLLPQVLINNAGVASFTRFWDRTDEEIDQMFDVNMRATFYLIREFSRHLVDRNLPGSIVNLGSVYGVVSPDQRIYTDCNRNSPEFYGATKAGIIHMTKYFATHLAPNNIRVNSISPGGIFNPEQPQGDDFVRNYSQRCPMGRMAQAEEMGGAIAFLASRAASYVTGQNIVVDGGFSTW